MDSHSTHLRPTLDPERAAELRLQADLRRLAQVETCTMVLRKIVESCSIQMRENLHARREEAARAAEMLDAITPPQPPQDAGEAQQPPRPPAVRKPSPYRPRLHAPTLGVLALRAVELLMAVSPLCAELSHGLIDQGVDVEVEVTKNQVRDFVLEFLRQTGIDYARLSKADAASLKKVMDRMTPIIDEAMRYVRTLPGRNSAHQDQMGTARSPSGP